MIEIFKFSNNMLQQLDKPESDCWINVVKPTEEELSGLRTLIEIPEEVILSLQDKEEMPTVEIRKKHVFIILRTPNKNSDLNYITVPLGIILTEDYVITLCFHNNDMIEKLKHNFKAHNKKELALNLMLMCSRIYLNYLGEINNMIDNLETQLYKSQKNKEIAKLLGLEQSLVYFSTSLESNEILVKKIASLKFFRGSPDSEELIENIQDETNQAIGMTKIYTTILSNLMDAFASMISNNLNIVLKLLTSITIFIAIPTLIASIYGMNIQLPFQNSPFAFLMIMLISVACSSIFLFYFWKNNMI